MTPRTDLLTDVQARLASIQALMLEQIAPNHAGDATVAELWRVIGDFAETVNDRLSRMEEHDGAYK